MQADPREMPTVVGVVVACDEAETIEACLASLAGLDALLLIDHGSTDDTAHRARRLGAVVHPCDAPDLGRLREFARTRVAAPWFVMIDADERLPSDGVARIRRAIQDAAPDVAAFRLPIRTCLGDRWLRWGGYYPAARPRVFRTVAVRWAPARVHERVECDGRVRTLPIDLHHASYRDLAEARAKTARYAALAALDDVERGVHRGRLAAAVRAVWRGVRVLCVRHGWLMGRLGWQLAWLQAQGVWWRYRGSQPASLRDR